MNIAIGIGLGLGGSARVLDADAVTLFAAMSVQPSDARKNLYDDFIKGLKADGNWTTLDAIYLLAAHDSQAALLNVKAPASFTATLVGTASPTFAVDRGFTTDGVDNYVNTNFNPSTAGGNYTQNSACWAFWSLTSGGVASGNSGQSDGTDGAFINPRDGSDNLVWTLNNTGATSTAGSTVGTGLFYVNRASSAGRQVGRNGVQTASNGSSTSVAVNNLTFKLGTHTAAAFHARQFAGAYIGGTRTEAQHAQIYARFLAFMQGVGAA